jgi:AbiV family abortive infection protein
MDATGQTAIIANAARLLKDAKLLLDHGRYASSFALAVLALEEIGKVVLDLWGWPEASPKPSKRPSAHVRKQAAVSSLLLAESVTKEWGDFINREGPSEALVEGVARSMHHSEPGRFHWMVGIGAVDKTKQLSLYRDDWFKIAGLSADQFDGDDVARVLERCRLAVTVVGDKRIMRVGMAIYETGLLRQSGRSDNFP